MTSRKRKQEDVSDDEGPTKRQKSSKTDFAFFNKDDIRAWASDNKISKTQADYIALSFSPEGLLAISEADLRKHKKLSGVTISRLLAGIKTINSNETKSPNNTTNNETVTIKGTTSNLSIESSKPKQDLDTKEGVLRWLNNVVNTLPKSIQVSDILRTFGAGFPHCVSEQTKQQIYQAALDSHGAEEYKKESLQIPFINGAPGIGKTRMALETLNILKECASASNSDDQTEVALKKVLNSGKCVMLYTSFGNGFSMTNNDELFWEQDDCSAAIAVRVLWKNYLQPSQNIKFDQVPVTKAMAQYLTLNVLIDHFQQLGVKYIVLAIDEMNMLHDINLNAFRKTIMSIGSVMLRHFKDLFVVFAGTIHSPLKKVITQSLGIAVSISPSLFSLADIAHILDESVDRFPYLTGWQRASNFRRCVADLSNPPRVFDYLMMEINKQIEKNCSKDVFTLQYDQFMHKVIAKADNRTGLNSMEAKFLINCCLTKKVLRFDSALPTGNKTIEDVIREGYAYVNKATSSSLDVQLSVPFFNLFTWLKLDDKVFGCAEHLFKFAWNDSNAIGPMAWERFNVKYTSFKLTLLRDDILGTIPFKTFHSGALFGADCATYDVKPRFAVPVTHVEQFPATFKGDMSTDGVTPLVETSTKPTNLFDSVCLNGKSTPGIDAFYWLSDNVIEFQQYKANDSDSKNPTKLTQAELDAEYTKAKELFDEYLAEYNTYKFVFGLVSNRIIASELKLQPNMYVVHQGNMEEYYGPFAGVAQIKAFTSVNVNTDDIVKLTRINGISLEKAKTIIKLREAAVFKDMKDLRGRVRGIFEDQADLVIEF